jgi:DNA-binding XRE family transcriptional regulator
MDARYEVEISACEPHRNVLTRNEGEADEKTLSDQRFEKSSTDAGQTPTPLSVNPRKSSRARHKHSRRRKAGKRGPKGSTRLATRDVRDIDAIAHEMRRHGTGFTHVVTIRGRLDVPMSAAKRDLSRMIAHIGQRLDRKGCTHIGLSIYENAPKPGQAHGLHVHHLIHAPRHLWPTIDALHDEDGGTIHVRRTDAGTIPYVTKQRRWLGPEYERGRPWQESAPIVGKRFALTRAAREIMVDAEARKVTIGLERTASGSVVIKPVVRVSAQAIRLPITSTATPHQFDFGFAEASRPIIDLAAARKRLGLTQAEIGARVGIRQPHVANVERGHDRLSRARAKAIAYVVERLVA